MCQTRPVHSLGPRAEWAQGRTEQRCLNNGREDCQTHASIKMAIKSIMMLQRLPSCLEVPGRKITSHFSLTYHYAHKTRMNNQKNNQNLCCKTTKHFLKISYRGWMFPDNVPHDFHMTLSCSSDQFLRIIERGLLKDSEKIIQASSQCVVYSLKIITRSA